MRSPVDLGIRAPPAGSFVKRKSAKKAKKVQNKKRSKNIKEPVDIEPIYIIMRG